MIIQGKKYTKEEVRQSLLHWYNIDRLNGEDWYKTAHKFAKNISELTGIELYKVCGIISALSPLISWERNKELAFQFCTELKVSQRTKSQVDKSLKILSAKSKKEVETILNGKKTVNFYLNILGDLEQVTIDRHMLKAIGSESKSITNLQYDNYKNMVQEIAKSINIKPATLQSVVWSNIREK